MTVPRVRPYGSTAARRPVGTAFWDFLFFFYWCCFLGFFFFRRPLCGQKKAARATRGECLTEVWLRASVEALINTNVPLAKNRQSEENRAGASIAGKKRQNKRTKGVIQSPVFFSGTLSHSAALTKGGPGRVLAKAARFRSTRRTKQTGL